MNIAEYNNRGAKPISSPVRQPKQWDLVKGCFAEEAFRRQERSLVAGQIVRRLSSCFMMERYCCVLRFSRMTALSYYKALMAGFQPVVFIHSKIAQNSQLLFGLNILCKGKWSIARKG